MLLDFTGPLKIADVCVGRLSSRADAQSVSGLDQHEGLQSDALCGSDHKASMLLAAAMARYLVPEGGPSP